MRSLRIVAGLLLCLSAGSARAADRGALRLLVVSTEERLPSETKALGQLEKRLGKRWTGPLWVQAAEADELAAARAIFSGAAPKAAPAAWSGAELVVALELLPPRGKRPNRITRGVGSLVVLRPPSVEPIWSQRVEGDADQAIGDERYGEWLVRLVELVAAGGAR